MSDDPSFRQMLPMPGMGGPMIVPESGSSFPEVPPEPTTGPATRLWETGWREAIEFLDNLGFPSASQSAAILELELKKRLEFPDWQYEVANGDTRLGFEDWFTTRPQRGE